MVSAASARPVIEHGSCQGQSSEHNPNSAGPAHRSAMDRAGQCRLAPQSLVRSELVGRSEPDLVAVLHLTVGEALEVPVRTLGGAGEALVDQLPVARLPRGRVAQAAGFPVVTEGSSV